MDSGTAHRICQETSDCRPEDDGGRGGGSHGVSFTELFHPVVYREGRTVARQVEETMLSNYCPTDKETTLIHTSKNTENLKSRVVQTTTYCSFVKTCSPF